MKILVDTNILLDIALERSPFLEKSALFLKTARQQHIRLNCDRRGHLRNL